MPINSGQLAYLTSLTPTQLSELVVQSGGPATTFVAAKFLRITNPSTPAYTFTYSVEITAQDNGQVLVTYDSEALTTTAVLA
jgi:hypothetical protein